MVITQKTLRPTLARILSVDEKFIVPWQENWYNPQDNTTGDVKAPSTWCAYLLGDQEPILLPFLMQDHEGNQQATQSYMAPLRLQFVGEDAEIWARSVSRWQLRSDVHYYLNCQSAQLMYKDEKVRVVDYKLKGNNTVKAYITTAWLVFIDAIAASNEQITSASIGGNLTIQ
jgi:hypothetical protein